MNRRLKLLLVEDSEPDAALIVRHLHRGGFQVHHVRVTSLRELEVELGRERWDVMITDYAMPAFNALDAITTARRIAPALPCVVISGTMAEEQAADVFRAGARDFITKERLTRLLPAIERELQEAADRAKAHEMEAAYRTTLERLRAMYELSPEVIAALRPDGTIVQTNPAALAMLGLRAEELTGKNYLELIHQDDAPGAAAQIDQVLKGEVIHAYPLRLRKADGGFVHVEASVIPIMREGRVTEMMSIARDASESVRTRETLAERVEARTAELRESNTALQQLLSVVSHEIRNPLASIISFTNLLLRNPHGELQPRHLQHLDAIRRSAEHLTSMINDLLEVSRFESGKLQINPSAFDFGLLVREMETAFAPVLAEKQQTMNVTLSSSPVWIRADKLRLNQVLSNLITNASKYSPSGTPIDVTAEVRGERLVISVADRGIGISTADQARLFRPFFRAENRETRSQTGHGLGLAVTKMLVELHGGSIAVRSEPGKGSVFTVTLPGVQPPGGTTPIAP
jgi:PAS domain S-box-containing protein